MSDQSEYRRRLHKMRTASAFCLISSTQQTIIKMGSKSRPKTEATEKNSNVKTRLQKTVSKAKHKGWRQNLKTQTKQEAAHLSRMSERAAAADNAWGRMTMNLTATHWQMVDWRWLGCWQLQLETVGGSIGSDKKAFHKEVTGSKLATTATAMAGTLLELDSYRSSREICLKQRRRNGPKLLGTWLRDSDGIGHKGRYWFISYNLLLIMTWW